MQVHTTNVYLRRFHDTRGQDHVIRPLRQGAKKSLSLSLCFFLPHSSLSGHCNHYLLAFYAWSSSMFLGCYIFQQQCSLILQYITLYIIKKWQSLLKKIDYSEVEDKIEVLQSFTSGSCLFSFKYVYHQPTMTASLLPVGLQRENSGHSAPCHMLQLHHPR